MAKVIMVLGTMSSVGKSLVSAGLLRVFRQDGYRAVPFKSQNMANNSYITREGLEMGRAQAMQAMAANVEPSVLMNPILLKPTSDMGSQVIVNGKSIGNMRAREYFEYKRKLIPDIQNALRELSKDADIIVIEGAGSPAEINLKKDDIVNMGMAKMVDSNAILVGDIDRGGVFAQLYGTLELLEPDERDRIKGLVINKFRGDKTILDPGIAMLEEKSGKEVLGCLPYARLNIDDEDSVSDRLNYKKRGLINIGVIKLPKMSNYSDFTAFERVDGIAINYIDNPEDIDNSDMIIIPGSKNTIADLRYIKSKGIDKAIKRAAKTKIVFGICGGFQMLGNKVIDPYCIEEGGSIEGLGLLNITTTLEKEKIRTTTKGRINNIKGPLSSLSGLEISGYEIHMGRTKGEEAQSLLTITRVNEEEVMTADGAYKGNVYGTYLHGFFDEGDIVKHIAAILAKSKKLEINLSNIPSYEAFVQAEYDKLADIIRQNMDMKKVYNILKEIKYNDWN